MPEVRDRLEAELSHRTVATPEQVTRSGDRVDQAQAIQSARLDDSLAAKTSRERMQIRSAIMRLDRGDLRPLHRLRPRDRAVPPRSHPLGRHVHPLPAGAGGNRVSTATPAIDLSRLPAPDVIENLDYEALLEAAIVRLGPDYVVSEADPAYKVLESAAYRELLLRQRVNDGARSVLLATAKGRDLDNLAALLGVERQVVTPADPDAIPPVEAVYESDERLRLRTQLAPSAISTAGPVSSYRYHALSAGSQVLDVAVASPAPGSVTVTVLSREGNGLADADLLAAVKAALNDDSVRPLGDVLAVQSAAIVDYQVTAELTIGAGPDSDAVARRRDRCGHRLRRLGAQDRPERPALGALRGAPRGRRRGRGSHRPGGRRSHHRRPGRPRHPDPGDTGMKGFDFH